MENIVVVGLSGHARVVIDTIERQGRYRIAGIVDTYRPVGYSCLGHAVLGDEFRLPDIVRQNNICGAVVAIGDNWLRHTLVARIRSITPGLPFVTVIHPSAQIADTAKVGAGSIILPGAIVCASADVGEFCILNTKASLDHDGTMADFSSFAPAVSTGGRVTVKPFAAVMLGANIIDSVCIGEHSVVGAGSLVLRDVPDFVVAYGSPAKVIRTRRPGDPYMGRSSHSKESPAHAI